MIDLKIGSQICEGWNLADPFYMPLPYNAYGSDQRNSLRPDNAKPARKDLTPRQIEWCRANIPAFMPRVTT